MNGLIRVFPSQTKATPTGAGVRFGGPELFDQPEEVHISVTFTWDIPRAEWLEKQWRHIAPVKVGGPALDDQGGEFVLGRYLRPGYVITSRGCPTRCPRCDAWKREGSEIRELAICDGWNVLDNNLLACSDEHIRAVFAMLGRQSRKPEFTGGLEAARFEEWHAVQIAKLKPRQLFFAYDRPADFEPLRVAVDLLRDVWLASRWRTRAYVLVGYRGDTYDQALGRLHQVLDLGIVPTAMLYRPRKGDVQPGWEGFARRWFRPAIARGAA